MNFKAENNEWHHGFQMTFQNGCTISVQFNGRNYCDEGKTTAEVAAWNSVSDWMVFNGDNWTVLTNGDTDVMVGQTTDDVAKMISELVKLK
jgi:roadblock/LC7 domain-containing protein